MRRLLQAAVALGLMAGIFFVGHLSGESAKEAAEFDELAREGYASNAFWDSVTADSASSSSAEPDSDCRSRELNVYTCWARWTPVGQSNDLLYWGTVEERPGGDLVVTQFERFADQTR